MEDNSKVRAQEVEKLRLLYFQVLDGVSWDEGNGFFIKHFSEQESYLLALKKNSLTKRYTREGVPADIELLKNAITNEDWSEEKENKVLFYRQAIVDNERNLTNLILQQRAMIEARIESDRKELIALISERQEILGKSIEDLVEDDVNEYVTYLSFYKDKKCTQPLFSTYEEFQSQELEDILKLSHSLFEYSKEINDDVIQKIAGMPFFLNKFSYCKDNFYYFLGIPLAQLTHHQNYLFSLGSRNLVAAQQSKGTPPDINTVQSLEEVVKWYNREYALITSRAQASQSQSSPNRTFKQV